MFRRFRRWAKGGVFERLFREIRGEPDFEYALIDGTIVQALRRVDPAHRKAPPPQLPQCMPIQGLRRSLEFYDAVGRRMAAEGSRG